MILGFGCVSLLPAQHAAFPADQTAKGVDTAQFAKKAKLWTRHLEVEADDTESFDGSLYPAYSITIFDVKGTNIGSLWKDEIKKRADKISSKRVIMAQKVSIPEIHAGYLDVYAKVEESKAANSARLSLAFMNEGTAISAKTDSIAHAKAQKFMYDLSVRMNRAVVNEQVANQEKTQEQLEKDLAKLQNENLKLHDSIDKNKRNLAKAEADQKQSETDLAAAKENVGAFETKMGTSPTEKDMKELSKMRKNAANLESRISKLISDQADYKLKITEAENAIPLNEQAQEAKKVEIEEQKKVVAQYRQKLADVE